MKRRKRQFRQNGLTLLELTVAVLVLGILSVGSLGYQYYATNQVRRAEARTVAGRLAKLILDHWQGQGAGDDYDPVLLSSPLLTITSSNVGPAVAFEDGSAAMLLGYYRVKVDRNYYFVTCSYRQQTTDAPRLLNVAVAWRSDNADDAPDDAAREIRYSTFVNDKR